MYAQHGPIFSCLEAQQRAAEEVATHALIAVFKQLAAPGRFLFPLLRDAVDAPIVDFEVAPRLAVYLFFHPFERRAPIPDDATARQTTLQPLPLDAIGERSG